MLLNQITPYLPKNNKKAKKQPKEGKFNEKQPLQEYDKRSIEIMITEIRLFISAYRQSKVFDPKKETGISAKVEQVRIQYQLDDLLPKVLCRFLCSYKTACLYDKEYLYGCTDAANLEYILYDIQDEYNFNVEKFIADVW